MIKISLLPRFITWMRERQFASSILMQSMHLLKWINLLLLEIFPVQTCFCASCERLSSYQKAWFGQSNEMHKFCCRRVQSQLSFFIIFITQLLEHCSIYYLKPSEKANLKPSEKENFQHYAEMKSTAKIVAVSFHKLSSLMSYWQNKTTELCFAGLRYHDCLPIDTRGIPKNVHEQGKVWQTAWNIGFELSPF